MSASDVEKSWDSLLRVREAVGLCEEPAGQCYFRLETENGRSAVSIGRPFRSSAHSGPVVAVLLDPEIPVPPASRADAVFSIQDLIRVRTVRYVEGRQPARIVLASSPEGLVALTSVEGGDVYLLGSDGSSAPPGVNVVPLHGADGLIPTSEILRELMARGIRSVYIEGGALTASRFLGEGNVDVLQVHISPLILGSGLSSFRLPPVPDVASSLRLAYHAFTPVDDGMMVVGTIARPDDPKGAS